MASRSVMSKLQQFARSASPPLLALAPSFPRPRDRLGGLRVGGHAFGGAEEVRLAAHDLRHQGVALADLAFAQAGGTQAIDCGK